MVNAMQTSLVTRTPVLFVCNRFSEELRDRLNHTLLLGATCTVHELPINYYIIIPHSRDLLFVSKRDEGSWFYFAHEYCRQRNCCLEHTPPGHPHLFPVLSRRLYGKLL